MRSGLYSAFKTAYSIAAATPLRRVPGAWKLSNAVFRRVWPSGHVIDVQGSKMYIDINEANPALRKTFQEYAMNLIHEESTTALLSRIVRPGDVVLDIGANIGYFTMLFGRLTGAAGRVFAFEPEPKNFSYLSKNVQLNGYAHVSALNNAVSNRAGTVTLFVCGYDSGHHTINQQGGIEAYRHGRAGETRAVQIEALVLDEWLKDKATKVDVVKIDVEGAEALVLGGMRTLLQNSPSVKIVVEFFPMLLKEMGTAPESLVRTLMQDFGFNVFIIGHDYSMGHSKEQLISVTSPEHLMSFIKEPADHLNLFVTRDANVM